MTQTATSHQTSVRQLPRIAYSADRFQVECTCGQVVYGPTTRTAHLVKAQRAHEKAVA